MKNKFFIFISLTALIVLGFFGFFHYRDTVFSKEILQLEISGPADAAMADEISYVVRYKNNGNFVLENPKLIFELPENSLTEDSKTRTTTNLKDLNPGDADSITFKARLLGKEGDIKTAKAALSYTPHNLSARYEANATLSRTIQFVPIDLALDMPVAMEKSKEINGAITYLSHVDYPLENLSVKLDSVNGFAVSSAVPASLDNAEWKIDVLPKDQGGKITFKGSASGEIGTHFLFTARIGMRVNGAFVVLKNVTQDAQVIQPQLTIFQQINGFSNYAANPGDTLNYQVSLQNTSATAMDNFSLQVKLEGLAFDFATLQTSQGQVQFPHAALFQIQGLAPGQQLPFTFSVKLKGVIAEPDNVIKNTVTAGGFTQEFTNSVNVGTTDTGLPPLQLNVGQ